MTAERALIVLALALASMPAAIAAQRSLRVIETLQPPPPPAAQPPPPPRTPATMISKDNQAGLKVELVTGVDYAIGEKLIVRASAERRGYLILADVDASGRVTQIYPNVWDLEGDLEDVNSLQPRTPQTIPGDGPGAGFDFTADYPVGAGMIVGLLSDKPVQIIDLPDVPAEMIGKPQALDFLQAAASTLKLLPVSETGPVEVPRWSIVATFYTIRR